MEKFEITKEQVLKVAEWGNSKDNELIKSWFPNAFKKELEIGKWYKSNCAIFYLTKIEDELGYAYGIDEGIWKDECSFNLGLAKNDVEATEQEVKTALINEANKKYPLGTNINCLVNKNKIRIVCKFSQVDYYFDANDMYLAGACIFEKGKWATITETITKEEAEKLLNKKII